MSEPSQWGAPGGGPPNYGPPNYGPPSYGPPPATSPYGMAPGWPPGPPYPPSGRRSRAPLIAVLVILALGATAGIIAVVASSGGSSSHKVDGPGPEQVVTTYLNALSQGDSALAFEQGSYGPPSTSTFLTDEVLQAQQAIAKIGDVKVDPPQDGGEGRASVRAHYTFGTKQVHESYYLTSSSGHWRLAAAEIRLRLLEPEPTLTLFGRPVRDGDYVWPGPLPFGSSSPYVSITNQIPAGFDVTPEIHQYLNPLVVEQITAEGKKVAASALSGALDKCATVKELEPVGCPQKVHDPSAVPGTALWQVKNDLAKDLDVLVKSGVANVSAAVTWTVTYQARAGGRTIKKDDFSVVTASCDVDFTRGILVCSNVKYQ